MGYYPRSATGLESITYPVGTTALPPSITSNAAANTKGAYTEVVASAPFTCNGIHIAIPATATGGVRHLFDIAIGGAGSEVVLLPDLLVDGSGGSSSGCVFSFIPCRIVAGTRIAWRVASSLGAQTVFPAITLFAAGDTPGISSWVTYGANAADSGGVTADPGATINTKGSYVELIASTSAVIQWLGVMISLGGNSAPAIARWSLDIAIGAAASEVVLWPDLRCMSVTSPTLFIGSFWGERTYIPAGTRIAVRCQCSINDATDRLIDVTLLAGTAPSEENMAILIQSPSIITPRSIAGY